MPDRPRPAQGRGRGRGKGAWGRRKERKEEGKKEKRERGKEEEGKKNKRRRGKEEEGKEKKMERGTEEEGKKKKRKRRKKTARGSAARLRPVFFFFIFNNGNPFFPRGNPFQGQTPFRAVLVASATHQMVWEGNWYVDGWPPRISLGWRAVCGKYTPDLKIRFQKPRTVR